jgi:hypothetical protein
LPERIPPPSGDHGVTPISNSRHMGSNSRSTERSISEYCTCMPANGDQPRSKAIVLACAATQAGTFDPPT